MHHKRCSLRAIELLAKSKSERRPAELVLPEDSSSEDEEADSQESIAVARTIQDTFQPNLPSSQMPLLFLCNMEGKILWDGSCNLSKLQLLSEPCTSLSLGTQTLHHFQKISVSRNLRLESCEKWTTRERVWIIF